VLEDVSKGIYRRTMVANDGPSSGINKSNYCMYTKIKRQLNGIFIVVDTNNTSGKLIIQDGVIIFDNVPIVTPNNDILVILKKRENMCVYRFSFYAL
jgi:ATP-binding cassette subfamily D (ALD) protein 3